MIKPTTGTWTEKPKPKGGFILHDHYAVVFKSTAKGCPEHEHRVFSQRQWDVLQEMAKAGHFVILECWDITKGKCVSN